MKFFCDQCKAQYLIADEKIGPKGVKIRCKRCDNIIIIRPQDDDQSFEPAADSADEETLMREDPLAKVRQELSGTDPDVMSSGSSAFADDDNNAEDEFSDVDGRLDDFAAPGSEPSQDMAAEEDENEAAADDLLASPDDFSDDETFAPSGLDDEPDVAAGDAAEIPEDPFASIDSDAPLDDRTMADFRSPGRIKEAFAEADAGAEDLAAKGADDDDLLADDPVSGDDDLSGDDLSGDDGDDFEDEDELGAEDDAPAQADSLQSSALDPDGDLLDNELSGAFDNVFGDLEADADDPFAQAGGAVDEDPNRQSTKFYSQGEMAKVEDERLIADVATGDDDAALARMDQPQHDAPRFDGFSGLAESEASLPEDNDEASALSTEQLWYVAIEDEQVGPESETELAQRWQKGEIDADSLVWQSGMADWLPLRDVEELKLLLAQQHQAASGPPQTEIERPGGLADFAPLADPFSSPAENSDPFAAVAEVDGLESPAGSDVGWRPHGMTEIYQAASLAESSAMQPAPAFAAEEAQDDDEAVDWQPGAAAALASLVEDEISSAAASPFSDDEQISSADDADLIAPKLKAPDDALVSGPSLGLPAGLATPLAADPFSQQLEENSDDINIAQLAGQSSMVMQRPSYVSKPKRELPWPLILGAGGGGLALIGLFTVVIILLLREPKPQVVVQPVAANTATSGKVAAVATAQKAAAPAAAAQGAAAGQEPVAAPAPAAAATKQPVQLARAEAKKKSATQGKRNRGNKKRSAKRKAQAAPKPKPEPKPEPKPKPKKHRSGNCDPILYPDGNCPTGSAAMAPVNKASKKKKLSKTDILRVVKHNIKSVRRCAAEQKRRNPRLARGTIKMSWYIRPDGRTKNVGIATPKFKGTYVGDCIKKSVKRWKFSSFDGDDMGPINFPFPLD